jgi:hypothetical protein
VSHFSGTGEYLGSYVIDLVSPVGVFDEGTGVVPDVIRLTTPDGRLIAEARYHNGQLVSHVEGPGMPRIQTCAGFVRCLLTKWAGIPGWIPAHLQGCMRVVLHDTGGGPLRAACAACVIVYVGVCWCQNARARLETRSPRVIVARNGRDAVRQAPRHARSGVGVSHPLRVFVCHRMPRSCAPMLHPRCTRVRQFAALQLPPRTHKFVVFTKRRDS